MRKLKHIPNKLDNKIKVFFIKKSTPKIKLWETRSPRIIVSLTSYNKRLASVVLTIKSLLKQTKVPDKIILYLYKDEKENLPMALTKLVDKNNLKIEWVDEDLRPHKKYYYAMQQFPNDFIITVDDDVIYDKHLIEYLWNSHLNFKKSVIATRAHQITFTNNLINPYNKWSWNSKSENTPRMDLVATGVGGILYPPHLLKKELLTDKEKIKKYIQVDDLWLKNIEVISRVSTVICDGAAILERNRIDIPHTQATALSNINVNENNNDTALKKLEKEYSFSKGILQNINKK
nr:glycosyltransferase [Lactobacillus rodentium]